MSFFKAKDELLFVLSVQHFYNKKIALSTSASTRARAHISLFTICKYRVASETENSVFKNDHRRFRRSTTLRP